MMRTKSVFTLGSLVLCVGAALVTTSCGAGRSTSEKSDVVHSSGEARTAAQVFNRFPLERRAGVPVVRADGRAARIAAAPRPAPTAAPAPAAGPTTTLVLFDTTGDWGWLGELYAIGAGSLASHFGAWTAKPVQSYQAGDLLSYTATIYVGSTFDEPLPTSFLDDVLSAQRPVVWLDDNIWQLVARAPSFEAQYGYMPWVYDAAPVAAVDYKGTELTRYVDNGAGIMTYSAVDPAAQVVATAVRADGTTFPWCLRSNNLTYVGENPMAYVTSNDRYIAFADLLFDALAPATVERHRALVRLEDVDATASPSQLRSFADYLASKNIPFSVAVIPTYTDPNGFYTGGVPETRRLQDAPRVARAISYMLSKGGTLVQHGTTHQYGNVENPYSGVTADDFEFYRTHVDPVSNFVIYDAPVAEDSAAWATARYNDGLAQLAQVQLPRPQIFEYPHYVGSDADSRALRALFGTVYHRGYYFGGALVGGAPSVEHTIGVMYPYSGTDLYGFAVVPENLGSYEPEAFNQNAPRLVSDLVATAHANRVVRDGVASVFYHPYYGLTTFQQVIEGILAEGYTFVSPATLLAN